MGDPIGKHAGFPAACPCNDEQWAMKKRCSFALLRIEFLFQIEMHGTSDSFDEDRIDPDPQCYEAGDNQAGDDDSAEYCHHGLPLVKA
ncbi:hypothetical protein SDC9_143012 [bioreactor metagenome]|uniref:Uncharacterized protein n=1 Tax=bioreactor metagenome TaxID=1076179 RepID=A0A645E2R4_9ZZZZ